MCHIDGATPTELIDVKGTLYGLTIVGGAHSDGTIFKITTSGTESVVYSFGSAPYDGNQPVGRLVELHGLLYGATIIGGTGCGCGTIFKSTTSGKEEVIYSFKGTLKRDGQLPGAGLTKVNGVLYGVTNAGGSTKCECGIVFSVTTAGVEKVLYRFRGPPDG